MQSYLIRSLSLSHITNIDQSDNPPLIQNMSSAHISIAPSLSLPLVVPRQAEDFTRVRLILTDTDGDGVLDFVTNQISVMTTATKTADVVVTTTRGMYCLSRSV